MRGIASYLLGGILTVLAIDFVVPPVGLGLADGIRPVTAPGGGTQIVDRTHKGDRLSVPTSSGRRPTATTPRAVIVGCEPPYSPLLASARATSPGRCVAEISYVIGTG
jgi:hypothetical protein